MKKLFKKYTETDLREAIKNSFSLAQTLEKLNIVSAGGNYYTLKKYVKLLNIDTSHFTGQGHNKGKIFGPKRPLEEYLVKREYMGGPTSDKIKKRLIKEKIFEAKCYKCNLTEWLGQPISLELHHIDGNHFNNLLNNLIILCPNCHSFTDNFRGKNKVAATGLEPVL